jgi:hypothetical protein
MDNVIDIIELLEGLVITENYLNIKYPSNSKLDKTLKN